MYWGNFNRLQPFEWVDFVFLSFRFDISALFTINLVFILLMLIPLNNRFFLKTVQWIFILGNWFFLVLNAVDVPFYAFNSRRTSFDAFQFLLPEIRQQIGQLTLHYWPVTLIAFLAGWALHWSFKKAPKSPTQKWSLFPIALIFWIGLGIFFIRNSIKLKPLTPGEAFTLSQGESGHGILNTPFLLFKTLELKPLNYQPWLTDSEMKQLFQPEGKESFTVSPNLKGQNLVIIILESFATEYTGLEGNAQTFTPFLDSLAREGLFFPHHFANGRTSRDALPSLFASIPSWMDESFVTSQYVSVQLDGLGSRFQRSGYQTAFYHGGKNGTMSFDVFSRRVGFKKYMGLNEYPEKGDFDGHWGIFDEPFLQFVAKDLYQTKVPFAVSVFTLSSHQPYSIPENYQGRLKKGPLPVHEAISYTDFALKRFFQTASKMPWFDNTLFVFTADHTQESSDPRYQNLMGQFDVPLIFFHPKIKLTADTSQWVQHLDLSPSLTQIFSLGSNLENQLGHSVFQKQKNLPIQYQDGAFHRFSSSGILSWRAEGRQTGWLWSGNKPGNQEKLELIGAVQYYRRGLVKDSLFLPSLHSQPDFFPLAE